MRNDGAGDQDHHCHGKLPDQIALSDKIESFRQTDGVASPGIQHGDSLKNIHGGQRHQEPMKLKLYADHRVENLASNAGKNSDDHGDNRGYSHIDHQLRHKRH